MKRKILVFTGYRSEYIKIKTVLDAIRARTDLEMKIVALGAHSLTNFGSTVGQIQADGFEVYQTLKTNVEGSDPAAMANSVGLAIIQITPVLNLIKPDIVLLAADRFEIFAAAASSAINNCVTAHVQGGEVSGTIDESLRHAITKLAHIHFPSTELSKQRIIKMGENPDCVFNVGCPAIDYIKACYIPTKDEFVRKYNLGKFLLVAQHPVTTEYERAYEQMYTTLSAIGEAGYQCVLIYPNPDAGSDEIRRAIRAFGRKKAKVVLDCYKTMDFEEYLAFLKYCDAIVGNSSSGIREAHVFGTPAINIGSRQHGRERTSNVVQVDHEQGQIVSAIASCAGKRIYPLKGGLYGDGNAGKKIAEILATIDFKGIVQKKLHY
jgi:UDP-N-acetylglucosamine 2-epimerase (non-hydrolysing)/GDP/UDP-N,N'-diacetylbacillosamine 2-epimerase (hydrolysing)